MKPDSLLNYHFHVIILPNIRFATENSEIASTPYCPEDDQHRTRKVGGAASNVPIPFWSSIVVIRA